MFQREEKSGFGKKRGTGDLITLLSFGLNKTEKGSLFGHLYHVFQIGRVRLARSKSQAARDGLDPTEALHHLVDRFLYSWNRS